MPKLLKRRWKPEIGAFGGRKAREGFSYEAYLPDPIAQSAFELPQDIGGVVSEAEVSLAQLGAELGHLSLLEALARQLLRSEAVASSRIEGLILSQRRLAKAAFANDAKDVTALSVLANMKAMELALRRAEETPHLEVQDLLDLHAILFSAFGDPSAGVLRTEQNWIGGAANSPRGAEFVPPPHEYVPELLEDLCLYLRRDDMSPVLQAAVAHAQFETVHPFADGNGRVGRCLIHVVLRRRRAAAIFVPPISLVLASDAKAYVKGLDEYRSGRVAEWCGVFAQATRMAALESRGFADDIAALIAHWREQSGKLRADSAAHRLIGTLPSHPLLDLPAVERLLNRSNQAARLAVLQLQRAGVLRQCNVGRRNRAWEVMGLFELLDRFEDRLLNRRFRASRR